MDVRDKIEDYVEYLVDCNAVSDLRDLSNDEKKKLGILILLSDHSDVYTKIIRKINSLIKNSLNKSKLSKKQ